MTSIEDEIDFTADEKKEEDDYFDDDPYKDYGESDGLEEEEKEEEC